MGTSIRAYAQHRGVSHEAVRKAISSGRIQKESDGSIDPTKADAQWEQHTRQAVAPAPASSQQVDALVPQASATPSGAADETRGVDYHRARAVRETYAARLARLDFEERSGKLVSRDDVNIDTFNLARKLRDRIQQIPRKVSHEIVSAVLGKPDVRTVEGILDAAIREALSELAQIDAQ